MTCLLFEGIPHTNLRVYVAATEAEYFEASADLVPEQVKAAFQLHIFGMTNLKPRENTEHEYPLNHET